MKPKSDNVNAQALIEYMLLLTVVVTAVLFAFAQQVPRVHNASNIYFDRATTGIIGKGNPCGDGVCNDSDPVNPLETPDNCCADCGDCYVSIPPPPPTDPLSDCDNDGICETPENCSCDDCSPFCIDCSDGSCNGADDCESCPSLCGVCTPNASCPSKTISAGAGCGGTVVLPPTPHGSGTIIGCPGLCIHGLGIAADCNDGAWGRVVRDCSTEAP